MKRRSSVDPPLVQPSIVLLSWVPQDRYCSVPNVLVRRAKQADDAVCLGARELPPRTTLILVTGKVVGYFHQKVLRMIRLASLPCIPIIRFLACLTFSIRINSYRSLLTTDP